MKHCIQFRKTSRELELLLQDVRLYPTRYVIFHLERKTNHIQGLPSDTIQNYKKLV
jgi:phospholipid/cholesterol/gamma-HCH transport system substrate-binding protein